jgi:transcriptional/translational regulatory protein YebC/TACO1
MNTKQKQQIEACNALIDALIDDKEVAQIYQSSQMREQALDVLNSIRSRIED